MDFNQIVATNFLIASILIARDDAEKGKLPDATMKRLLGATAHAAYKTQYDAVSMSTSAKTDAFWLEVERLLKKASSTGARASNATIAKYVREAEALVDQFTRLDRWEQDQFFIIYEDGVAAAAARENHYESARWEYLAEYPLPYRKRPDNEYAWRSVQISALSDVLRDLGYVEPVIQQTKPTGLLYKKLAERKRKGDWFL